MLGNIGYLKISDTQFNVYVQKMNIAKSFETDSILLTQSNTVVE